jgi:signal transduction histidine kinase
LLVLIAGGPLGQSFPLGPSTVIGRGPEATIRIDDGEVSRTHVRITERDGRLLLEDLESRNGTFLNGAPVSRATLTFGDRIQMGGRVMVQLTRYAPLEDQIRERQRLEILGRLAAGVVHDLNNMLAAIGANLDFLELEAQSGGGASEPLLECISDLKDAARHANNLTPRLVAFAKSGDRGYERVDVSAVSVQVAQIVRRTFRRVIEVRAEIEPDLQVVGNATDLHQVLMNLCLNARDAMPDGGVLCLRAMSRKGRPSGPRSPRVSDVHLASTQPPDGSERTVVVEVEDSGHGIDPDLIDRIFEPFFTTKGRQGSGLGLATAREIVDRHGGTIAIAGREGGGTCFTVELPVARPDERRSDRPTDPPAILPPSEGGTRLLIVEDEPIVRRSLRRLLARHGYEIREAGTGSEAVECCGESWTPDIVILDLDLPHGSGESALEQIRVRAPEASVVLHSGDPRHDVQTAERLQAAWLPKPAPREKLLEIIARAGRRTKRD